MQRFPATYLLRGGSYSNSLFYALSGGTITSLLASPSDGFLPFIVNRACGDISLFRLIAARRFQRLPGCSATLTSPATCSRAAWRRATAALRGAAGARSLFQNGSVWTTYRHGFARTSPLQVWLVTACVRCLYRTHCTTHTHTRTRTFRSACRLSLAGGVASTTRLPLQSHRLVPSSQFGCGAGYYWFRQHGSRSV
jgi:hypothetical protein